MPFPRDCGEEMQNGASTSRPTTIFLNGNRERPLHVFCDMETDGGGWLVGGCPVPGVGGTEVVRPEPLRTLSPDFQVFQRRMDGKTDFWRDWEDYAHGFGNVSREFWLGGCLLGLGTRGGEEGARGPPP